MTTKDRPSIEELIRANSKVDAELVRTAREQIREIREKGIVPQGYRLSGRRTTLLEKTLVKS